VIGSSDAYTGAVFAAAPRLQIVARCGVGIDTVDLEAATRAGVLVTNTPGVMAEAVADYAMALLLGIARRNDPQQIARAAGGGARLEQWDADLAEPQRVAEAIQADLRTVGISAKLEGFEWGQYLQRVQNGEANMALFGWTGDNGDPDNYLYTILDKDSAIPPGAQNVCFWKDDEFHRLVTAAQTIVDRAKRAALYRQALARFRDEAPCVPIAHTSPPIAFNRRVKGYVPNPDSAELFQYMWLDDSSGK